MCSRVVRPIGRRVQDAAWLELARRQRGERRLHQAALVVALLRPRIRKEEMDRRERAVGDHVLEHVDGVVADHARFSSSAAAIAVQQAADAGPMHLDRDEIASGCALAISTVVSPMPEPISSTSFRAEEIFSVGKRQCRTSGTALRARASARASSGPAAGRSCGWAAVQAAFGRDLSFGGRAGRRGVELLRHAAGEERLAAGLDALPHRARHHAPGPAPRRSRCSSARRRSRAPSRSRRRTRCRRRRRPAPAPSPSRSPAAGSTD